MFFFEGKIELYNMLFLLVIPVGTPVLIYFIRRRFLWIAPLAALILGLILTVAFYPYFFTDIFTNNYDITTGYWLFLIIPAHCIISVISTLICYTINYLRKRSK